MPLNDISNQRFGNLIAIRRTNKKKNKKYVWECRCDCGGTALIRIDSLTTGNTASCGCIATKTRRESALKLTAKQRGKNHPRFIDMSGEKYGRLTVLEYLSDKQKWLCVCSCGNNHEVPRDYLVYGKTRSCGCLDYERMCGKNNHRWNDELAQEDREENRFTDEYRSFVKKIFDRDWFRCRICDASKPLNIHHLYNYASYPEQRFEEDNSITLCRSCHQKFHSWMGGTVYPCTPDDFFSWLDGLVPAPHSP